METPLILDADDIILYCLKYSYFRIYVETIQSQFRIYLLQKQIHKKYHQIRSCLYLKDIVEYGFLPPVHDSLIPLLRQGGSHYREAKRSFDGLCQIIPYSS